MASSPGLNFLIAKYLRGLPNSNLANVRQSLSKFIYLFEIFSFKKEFVQTLEQNNVSFVLIINISMNSL
jgi:hypothetical protein